MSHNIVYLSVHVNNLMGQLKKCANIDNKFSKSFSDHYFNDIWHSFYELMSWVWMQIISRINNYIWDLAWRMFNIIWLSNEYKEMSGKESFYIPAGDFCASEEGKSLKSCWWFPGEVLLDRPWEFRESCESGLLLHLPPSHLHLPPSHLHLPHLNISHPPTCISHPPTCISHPPTFEDIPPSHFHLPPSHTLAALRQQVNSFAQSDLILDRGVFLGFFLAEKTSKLWKVITCLKNLRLKNNFDPFSSCGFLCLPQLQKFMLNIVPEWKDLLTQKCNPYLCHWFVTQRRKIIVNFTYILQIK